jgi:hypothetical protein
VILNTFTDLNIRSSKQLIGRFFQKHKDIKEIFEKLLNNKTTNLPTLFQLYQERSWGDNILEGFKTYKDHIFYPSYNMKFLSQRPALLALIVFINNIEERWSPKFGQFSSKVKL